MCECVYICVYVYVYVCACVCVCMDVCVRRKEGEERGKALNNNEYLHKD